MKTARWLIVMLLLAASASADVQHASIEGIVRDASSTPLPGVRIELRDLSTNAVRSTTTGSGGRYRITNVTPGSYAVTVSLAGFVSFHSNATLTIGQALQLNVSLHLESVQENVEVSAQPSGLDSTSPAPPAVIDTERIEELPVQARNYLDFVLLTPGVVQTPQLHAAAIDSGFSFAGQRPRSNVLTIDGLNNNDEYSGSARTELSLETVREFDVVSHGSSAESGGGSGGYINVVTKSGANTMHGDAFIFAEKPPIHRYRTGGALGGPLIRDRMFYYIAGEYETSSSLGRREQELSAKLNDQLSDATSLVARIAANDNREKTDHVTDSAATATLTSILGREATNEVRSQVARRSVDERDQRYLEAGDTATVGWGEHLFRVGGDVTSIDVQPIRATRYSAFAQDSWTHGNFTIDGGLRLDNEQLQQTLGISNQQLQPRFGFAWTPITNWVLRGTAGTFADRIPLIALERPLRGEVTVDRGGWSPASTQYSISGEHAFAQALLASVTLQHVRGSHLLQTVDDQLQAAASSSYNGCTITVVQRMVEDVEWAASYTFSKAIDDAADFDQPPHRGLSRFDQRHRLAASALFEVSEAAHIEMAPIVIAASGKRTTLNLRTVKYFPIKPHGRLDFVVEGFELLNRQRAAQASIDLEF